MKSEKETVAAAALQVQNQLGLVRSRQRYGVRVVVADYERAHKFLKPDFEPPAQLKLTHMYKASSLPHGARFQDVASWLAKLAWKAKPLRQLSVQQCLIGAESPPMPSLHSFNGSPALLQPAPTRAPRQPVVQALAQWIPCSKLIHGPHICKMRLRLKVPLL